MGYSSRPAPFNGKIKTFWPDDTDNAIYIIADTCGSLQDLIDSAQEKWPGASLDNISIDVQKIQTDCIGYDLYDPIDYTDFIILTRNPTHG